MTVQVYGDISPRTAAHAVARMLTVGLPHLTIERFAQTYVMPKQATKVAKFRRYEALALATTPLVEGVTPPGKKVTTTDVTAQLEQYGDYVTFTDVIQDTHEDPYLQQVSVRLGEQQAQTAETVSYNVLKAGTNVQYANGGSRSAVNTVISTTLQRRVTRTLMRQNADMFTEIVKSTPDYNTQPIEAAYIALCHSDLDSDVRNMTGYINPKQYGTVTPWANEIGSVENVRYLRSTLFTPFLGAGAADATKLNTAGNVDVYPVLYIAKESYGIVPLKGENVSSIAVVNPKPAQGDPLGQRGTAGWKHMRTTVILNDAWMVRLEVAVTL